MSHKHGKFIYWNRECSIVPSSDNVFGALSGPYMRSQAANGTHYSRIQARSDPMDIHCCLWYMQRFRASGLTVAYPMIPSAQSFLLTPISTAVCGERQPAFHLHSASKNNDVPAEPQSSPWLCPSAVNPARCFAWAPFRTVYCSTIRA